MIPQETIQAITSRIDIADIVGSFVKLKKRGANLLGLCPFHSEKTGSFTVSPAKEIYKCFGCGRSGNAISFLMEHEKYSYVEAITWLGQKYGIEVKQTERTPEQVQQQLLADSLYIVNSYAQHYFSSQLFESEEGDCLALTYLVERGFSREILKKFQVGYCPKDGHTFYKTAQAAQYNIDRLKQAGLVHVNQEFQPVDAYRGRIIFPVHNQSGKVIGFGARIIGKNDRAPKYLNTPENEIYTKSKILYGLFFARQRINQLDECYLVEGYTDVVALHQAGIENVVASGGTSLTTDQLRLIKKYTRNLTIIYDGDAAGVKAALRGLDMALEEGLNVKLVLIPDNEDPDSYVRKVGANQFNSFVQENKTDFVIFKLKVSLQETGNDPAKRSVLVNDIARTLSKINKLEDFTRQQDYIRECARLLKIEEKGLTELVNKLIRDTIEKKQQTNYEYNSGFAEQSEYTEETFQMLHKDDLQEKAMVKLLLEFGMLPWEQQRVCDYIFTQENVVELLENPVAIKVFEMYRQMASGGSLVENNHFIYCPDIEISSFCVSLLHNPHELSRHWKESKPVYNSLEEGFKKYLGTGYAHRPVMDAPKSHMDNIISTLNYFKLRKIKGLMKQNLVDLENDNSYEKFKELVHPHMYIKDMERDITGKTGTVIKND